MTAPPGYHDRWIEVDGRQLHLLDWGDPADPPVLLLHGLTENAHTYHEVAPWLVAAGWRVVALDWIGHGDSDAPVGTVDLGLLAKDALAVVEALGLERPGLIGHSMGGRVTLLLAGTHPARWRWAVVEDAPPSLTAQSAGLVAAYLASLPPTFPDVAALVRFLRRPIPLGSREFLRYRALTSRWTLPGGDLVFRFTLGRDDSPNEDLWPVLSGADLPVLVLRGRGSKVLVAEEAARMAALLPRGRLVTVERAGHVIHGDNPAGYLAAVGGFLGDVEGQPAP